MEDLLRRTLGKNEMPPCGQQSPRIPSLAAFCSLEVSGRQEIWDDGTKELERLVLHFKLLC